MDLMNLAAGDDDDVDDGDNDDAVFPALSLPVSRALGLTSSCDTDKRAFPLRSS